MLFPEVFQGPAQHPEYAGVAPRIESDESSSNLRDCKPKLEDCEPSRAVGLCGTRTGIVDRLEADEARKNGQCKKELQENGMDTMETKDLFDNLNAEMGSLESTGNVI